MHRLCLIIIDGFGVAPPGPGNARTLASLPTITELEREVPSVLMDAAGEAVGLPQGQQGASEPGHLTIGAGRVVWQPLMEINRAIDSGAFFKNPVLISVCERSAEKGVPLHLIGLYSRGGVHSHTDHWHAMLKIAKDKGVERVFLHLFSDGRDVAPQHFCVVFELLKKEISQRQLGAVASLVGRFYAMDRDRQYADRTKVAYDLLTGSEGEEMDDLCKGAQEFYARAPDKEKSDYYITPLKTSQFHAIKPEDIVVCINFRSDRMIQIVRALEDEHFNEFPRPVRVSDVSCMGPYSDHLPIAYPPPRVQNTFGEVVANAGLKQLRVAETDKFAHVTFFFNAQVHEPYEGEDRILIESPKVKNYAETPEMSADEVAQTVAGNAAKEEYGLIVVNFANPDLVGHGGKLDAAIRACESVDRNLAKILPVLEEHGYDWIVTSDHGNAEQMLYPDSGKVCTSHTSNQVQTFVHSKKIASAEDLKNCKGLKDVAPLCLKLMEIPMPEEMQ